MDIFRDSIGNYICKRCQTSYKDFSGAQTCVDAHKLVDAQNASVPQLILDVETGKKVERYTEDMLGDGGTLEATKRLTLSMLEDYEISRSRDLADKQKVGPLTMNLAKNAAEVLTSLNKLIYGEKSASLNVHVDARKKSDLEALRSLMLGNAGAAGATMDVTATTVTVSSAQPGGNQPSG